MELSELIARIKQFRDERDWKQFHDPKNLSEALSIEAGELLEHFLWKDKSQIALELENPETREEIGDELADVLHYALLLADAANIDIVDASVRKIAKNDAKYPVEKARGKATKYTKL